MSGPSRSKLTSRQIKLIRDTIGKDCTSQEFEVFIELAEMRRLDPFLGQIVPIVVNRDDPARRRMNLLVSREGQRIVAQRCGDYRPASKPARFRASAKRVSVTNPLGLISATVYLWKLGGKDEQWYPVAGHAYWDEYAPAPQAPPQVIYSSEIATLTRIVGPTHATMSTKGNSWLRMPRLMLAKCAEMQALRAGWPAQYAGLYDEAEFEQVSMDQDAPDLERGASQYEDKGSQLGGSLTIYWAATSVPERITRTELLERAPQFLREMEKGDVLQWSHLNRDALRQLWESHPRDALSLKRLIDELSGQLPNMVH